MFELILIAFAPALVLLYIFYKRDKARPEPRNIVIKIFLVGGIFVSILAGLLEEVLLNIFFNNPDLLNYNFSSFAQALKMGAIPGFVEEILKFVTILIFAYKIREFDEKADGIIYALCVGMGFAAIENFFYVVWGLKANVFGSFFIAFLRAPTAVPFHAILAVIMGYFIGQAKFSQDKRKLFFFLALFLPILLHTFYDALIFYFQKENLITLILELIIIIFAIIGIIFTLRLTKETVNDDTRIIYTRRIKTIGTLLNLIQRRKNFNQVVWRGESNTQSQGQEKNNFQNKI
jgi:RsiW-degrading membrane proteinase PrsW (M82 family)